jgi:hypothetical protein
MEALSVMDALFVNCYCDDLFQILRYMIVSLRKGKLREKKTKGAHLKADQVARTICTSQCGFKGMRTFVVGTDFQSLTG